MKNKNLFLFILLTWGNIMIFAQDCSINAGGNATICGTSYTLQGSVAGSRTSTPTWKLVSKPAGAPNPVINGANTYAPNVTGMTSPGNYVFEISQSCTTGAVTSQVTITAPGEVSTFTAGPDITNVSALTGTATLAGVIPAGYTASWTYYSIINYENYGIITTQNATMSNNTTATPSLILTKKANHDTDPAYRAVLRITSINNPNCWYEDDAIVRFIPNPQISIPAMNDFCYQAASNDRYLYLDGTSPIFSTTSPGSSGNPAFGTTVSLNVISQPAGGNISFSSLLEGAIYFNGVNAIGTYKFTVTVTNANGTYTTPQISYTYSGISPKNVDFLDSSYPEQMAVYSSGGSAGAVYCNYVGKTTPINIYFKIDPADPASVITNISNIRITPPGGAPILTLNGAGTMNRNIVATPPAGGWQVGTYAISINTQNGTCNTTQAYYIHISDGNRSNVSVPNTTTCYPGSGVVTATIPLPEVYKGMVNSSYFQDFNGRYDFTLVSKPAGAANPTYEASNFRTLTNTSTVISNLDTQGEYVFKIKAVPGPGTDPRFLDKEYECSGASLESTFSIFVSKQINSNAGSDKAVSCNTTVTLAGNDPGVTSTGQWELTSKPAGATDPIIVNPSLYNTAVKGLSVFGVYKFSWKVTTGTCTSMDEVVITFDQCTACYKPGVMATTGNPALNTNFGITSLGRAGADHADNWPMIRKGGWIALESKTKGFVPNRVDFNTSGNPVGIPVANFIEGMLVYDMTNKCMKMYTLKEGDTSMAWHCISTQACPE
ncbi:hypothetical protein [Chryseobacterium joostei]|uniref:hypothetical protein n=1 Tax=Chryseobacterium joostei TaxID=112234 RepID=UPI003D140FAC